MIARVDFPAFPMCIDFAADGRLLVVAGRDGRLLHREHDGSLAGYADLSHVSANPWNDIVVDRAGNAYVGNVGFDFPGGEFAPGTLALVSSDGTARQVADGLAFPNGIAITSDERTLIVAESYAERLTAFEIDDDGGLRARRVCAETPGDHPDGICVDAEGALWYADVGNKHCVRVREGGEVLDAVTCDRAASRACSAAPAAIRCSSSRSSGAALRVRRSAREPARCWPPLPQLRVLADLENMS